MTTIALIVAAADNNVIGLDNVMPWHIPEDFKHFKEITMGKPCIMGRKTFESIVAQLGKPLPGRTNIIVSRAPTADGDREEDDIAKDNVSFRTSLIDALQYAFKKNPEEIMIIGGAQVYAQALEQNLVDKIYLTRVHQSPEGDTFFPELNMEEWIETERVQHAGYSFITLNKK